MDLNQKEFLRLTQVYTEIINERKERTMYRIDNTLSFIKVVINDNLNNLSLTKLEETENKINNLLEDFLRKNLPNF
jgi:hypothetical protein